MCTASFILYNARRIEVSPKVKGGGCLSPPLGISEARAHHSLLSPLNQSL